MDRIKKLPFFLLIPFIMLMLLPCLHAQTAPSGETAVIENIENGGPAEASAENSSAPSIQDKKQNRQGVLAEGSENVFGDEVPGDGTDTEGKDRVVLQAGDRVIIKIYPEDEFIKGGEMEISSEGNITLPLVGKVTVANLEIPKAEKKIAEIVGTDYLVNPEVVIELKKDEKALGKTISKLNFLVLGQVKQPGTYPIPPGKKVTLLYAISAAGGFTDVANMKRVKVVRKQGNARDTLTVNVEDVFNGNASDMEIRNGDVIHVPESLF